VYLKLSCTYTCDVHATVLGLGLQRTRTVAAVATAARVPAGVVLLVAIARPLPAPAVATTAALVTGALVAGGFATVAAGDERTVVATLAAGAAAGGVAGRAVGVSSSPSPRGESPLADEPLRDDAALPAGDDGFDARCGCGGGAARASIAATSAMVRSP